MANQFWLNSKFIIEAMMSNAKCSVVDSKLDSVLFDPLPIPQLQNYSTIHLHKGFLFKILLNSGEGMQHNSFVRRYI